ncbi:hypothetical protein ACS0TY_024006 [Phlomoides rotata]
MMEGQRCGLIVLFKCFTEAWPVGLFGLLLRPIYKQIAENKNAEIFSANTLLVILGTSLLTARAGLSMALGAFLAGLLLAETEFSLQVAHLL